MTRPRVVIVYVCVVADVSVLLYTAVETAGSATGAMIGLSSVISTRLNVYYFRILCQSGVFQ